MRAFVEELIADYSSEEHGMEIRQVAGGFRMATKPEHHDVVRAFARSLKPPVRLSIAALETLAVIAYKQPVTAPEISEIRGVEAAGVLGTLLDRKLITTAGRKQVIGRPILYKTSKQFLMRFGLNELSELPSMEEFEKLAIDGQVELFHSVAQQPRLRACRDRAGDANCGTAERGGIEESSPEETPDGARIEPSAASSADEQRSTIQTPEKTESDGTLQTPRKNKIRANVLKDLLFQEKQILRPRKTPAVSGRRFGGFSGLATLIRRAVSFSLWRVQASSRSLLAHTV